MGTAELHAEIDRLTADDLPLDPAVLGAEVLEFERAMRRLQAEKSRRLGEFDLISGCEAESHTTTKAWLTAKTRISPSDAAGQQAIARIHGELPELFAAWHSGRTSYEHLRHVEINLRKLPAELWTEIDSELTAKAVTWPAKEFGQWLREFAQSLGPDPKPKDETQHDARRLSLTLGFNGMTNVNGSLTPEVAEKFWAALHAAARPDAADEIRTKGQRNADALERILEAAATQPGIYLAQAVNGLSCGSGSTSTRSPRPPNEQKNAAADRPPTGTGSRMLSARSGSPPHSPPQTLRPTPAPGGRSTTGRAPPRSPPPAGSPATASSCRS